MGKSNETAFGLDNKHWEHKEMEHIYFRPIEMPTPTPRMRAIAAYILNRYTNQNWSVSRWRKVKPAGGTWSDGKTIRPVRFDFSALVKRLHKRRKVDAIDFSLPYLLSPLVDSPVDIGLPQALVGSDGGTVVLRLPMAMGEDFPLVPQIDRDGFAAADMQALVESNIVSLFHSLVSTSHNAPWPRSGWLTSFRMLINECVTAIDMLLHKIYMLAEYRGAELGWKFDREAMGTRHGTRLSDKFRWVSMVSGGSFRCSGKLGKHFSRSRIFGTISRTLIHRASQQHWKKCVAG